MTTLPATRTTSVPRLMVPGLLMLSAAALLCACALSDAPRPSRAVIWGSLAFACYTAGLVCITGTREGDLGLARWKLGPWALAWCAAAGGLATLTFAQPQQGAPAQIALAAVQRALWLTAAGMTCFAAAYLAGPGQPLRHAAASGMRRLGAARTGTIRGPLTPWALYAVATAARMASAVTTGRIGYAGNAASAVSAATSYGQILAAVGMLAPLAICAAALQACRERLPGARVTLTVLFAAEMAYGAVSGGKQVFVLAVLAVLIPASAARMRLPKGVLIAGLAVFLTVVIPFTTAYRDAARGSVPLSASQAAREAPAILRQDLTGTALLAALPASGSYLLDRIQEIDGPAIIVQRTPSQIPYASPVQLAAAPAAALIPRAVWPGKPILDTGYQFGQQYYGLPPTAYTSPAITPVGDLWRHGGWIPVIAGMLLLGFAVRLLDDVLDVRANPHAAFLVLLLFPFVKGENDWVSMLATLPALGAVWLLAVMLAFRKPRAA